MPIVPWKSCRVSWYVMSQGGKTFPLQRNASTSCCFLSGPEAAWRQVPSTEPREVGIRSGAGCRAFEERCPENTGRARRGAGGWLKTTGMIHPYMKKYGGRNCHCICFFVSRKGNENLVPMDKSYTLIVGTQCTYSRLIYVLHRL